MRIRCTHAYKPHLHASLTELAACVARYKTLATRAQVDQLKALGVDLATAEKMTRDEAVATIEWGLEYIDQRNRKVNANGAIIGASIPF